MKKRCTPFILWFILALSIIFYCYEFFLRISPSVEVGPLMQYYELNAFGISKLLAVFYLAYTLGQIPAGLLLDQFSLRLILAIAALACALGAYLFIATPYTTTAWLGRFIIGFAASFAFIAVLKISRTYLPCKYFTRIVATTVSVGTLIAAYGDVIASYFTNQNFKAIFIISILLGVILAALFFFLYYAVDEFTIAPTQNPKNFTWQDVFALFKNYSLWLNGLVGGLFYLPTTVLGDVWGNYFLRSQYHLSLTQSSYIVTWLFIGWMIGSPIMGYLADRLQKLRSIITINALLSAWILFHMLFLTDSSVTTLSLYMLLLGITSSAQLIIWRIFHQIAPLNITGTGIAFTNMIIMLICAFGQLLIGFLLSQHQNSHNINLYTTMDYHMSLMILPFTLIAAAILVRLIPKLRQ